MPVRLRKAALPYLLLLPGLGWLLLFFAVPLAYMAVESLKSGSPFAGGFHFTWEFSTYTDALRDYDKQFIRSFEYAGMATLIALLIGYPLAYVIAFRGGRWRNAMLLAVIVPFFVTYLIRTLSWETILSDDGFVVNTLQAVGIVGAQGRLLDTTNSVVLGITYNFLPFMILPLYASLERIDPRLQEAGYDLYGRRRDVFLREGHPQEHVAPATVEVVARLLQARVDPLQRGVERQDHERQEVVGDAQHHRVGGVEQAPVVAEDADGLERAHHEPVVAQDRLPGQRADQVGDEERDDHRQQHRVAPAPATERDHVGERVPDDEAEQRGQPGVLERAQELLVERRDRVGVVRELPVEQETGVGCARLERLEQHVAERQGEEQRQPSQPRQQEQVGQPGSLEARAQGKGPRRRSRPGTPRSARCPLPASAAGR